MTKEGSEGSGSGSTFDFDTLMANFQQLIKVQNALAQVIQAKEGSGSNSSNPKISIRVLTFKEDPKENITVQLLQCYIIFETQEIADSQLRIRYNAIGLEGVALQQYLNKIQIAGEDDAFDGWRDFQKHIKAAFMPSNYQHHLRQ